MNNSMTAPSQPSNSSSNLNNYVEDKEKIANFLQTFTNLHTDEHTPKYANMMQEVANRERIAFPISLDDIALFDTEGNLIENMRINSRRYMNLFAEVIDDILPQPTVSWGPAEDAIDILHSQRLQQAELSASNSTESNAPPANLLPRSLMRRFEVQLVPEVKMKCLSIRTVNSTHVGRIIRVKGMVTRVSDVKPLLSVATYTCDSCGFEVYQEINARQFTPLNQCPSKTCGTNNSTGKILLQTKASKFIKYQEVKFQELPDQVPMGNIPRTMTVHLRGELTRTCDPGAVVTFSGIFLPLPYATSRNRIRAGLITDTYLEATDVFCHKKRYSEMEVSTEMENQVKRLQQEKDFYGIVAKSIAPEIYGHQDVKKALLLMMIGGSTKKMDDGMKVRGDLNILLMGDPGVAKSQLLKHIAVVAPRGVYTTGKGSSGVGLTAAIVRDPMTKELTLEGGTLVLADMGICCIDEFDKMDEGDRTAILEVMEQQTVSIAKAGITTTLNARTSVLAAANPLYGRYNRKLTASQNINLPNALLSRFDLLFLLLDKPNYERDQSLARHVTFVHRFCKNPEMDFEPISPSLLRYIVAIARQYNPVVPDALGNYIVEAYVTLRMQDALNHKQKGGQQTVMTARQLLSVLRLSHSLARLRFSSVVSQEDVDESIRLVHMSKASLDDSEDSHFNGQFQDLHSKIYRLIVDYAQERNAHSLPLSAIEPIILQKGFTSYQLQQTLAEYEKLEVMQLSSNGTTIDFVS